MRKINILLDIFSRKFRFGSYIREDLLDNWYILEVGRFLHKKIDEHVAFALVSYLTSSHHILWILSIFLSIRQHLFNLIKIHQKIYQTVYLFYWVLFLSLIYKYLFSYVQYSLLALSIILNVLLENIDFFAENIERFRISNILQYCIFHLPGLYNIAKNILDQRKKDSFKMFIFQVEMWEVNTWIITNSSSILGKIEGFFFKKGDFF